MRSVTAGALLFSFLYAATAVHAAPPSDAAAPAANPAAKPVAKPAAKTAPAAKPATATPSAAAASAAPCHTSGTYDAWLAAFEREALTQKISQRAISTAAPHLTYDQFRIANDALGFDLQWACKSGDTASIIDQNPSRSYIRAYLHPVSTPKRTWNRREEYSMSKLRSENDMKLHMWLNSRSMSLDDALTAIKDEAIATHLSEFLEAQEDKEVEVTVAAYERLLDVVDAAIAREPDNLDLLIQLRDDLTYFPEGLVT